MKLQTVSTYLVCEKLATRFIATADCALLHYSSVTLDPVVICGVTLIPKLIAGVTVPEYSAADPAEFELGYTLMNVNVPVLVSAT